MGSGILEDVDIKMSQFTITSYVLNPICNLSYRINDIKY